MMILHTVSGRVGHYELPSSRNDSTYVGFMSPTPFFTRRPVEIPELLSLEAMAQRLARWEPDTHAHLVAVVRLIYADALERRRQRLEPPDRDADR
jgi:hypothetical protein